MRKRINYNSCIYNSISFDFEKYWIISHDEMQFNISARTITSGRTERDESKTPQLTAATCVTLIFLNADNKRVWYTRLRKSRHVVPARERTRFRPLPATYTTPFLLLRKRICLRKIRNVSCNRRSLTREKKTPTISQLLLDKPSAFEPVQFYVINDYIRARWNFIVKTRVHINS